MTIKTRNFTPHAVVVISGDGEAKETIEPEGIMPRLAETREEIGEILPGIPVASKVFTGLVWVKVDNPAETVEAPRPRPIEAVPPHMHFPTWPGYTEAWIVSGLVAEAVAREYPDVLILVPDQLVRDEKKRVVGCRAFWTLEA